MFVPAISTNGATSGTTTSSPSSFPSSLDRFNFFSSPSSTPLPLSPPPLPHSAIDSPSRLYERRKHPSSSPGSAVLLLVGLTGGISLLASSSTFLLLRRSLANSVAHKLNQRTDRTIEEIRNSLSRVEGRLGALEGRIKSGKGGRGGLGGGQGEGGSGGGQLSSQILLSDLKEEVSALRRDMEKKRGEKEGWASGLREEGKGRTKVADVSSSDLRARSPYDFVPPPHSELKASVVDAATVASPPPSVHFADQLIKLVKEQAPDAPSATPVSDKVKVALENKRSNLETQSAKSWKQAFDKGRSDPPPPLVRVKGSDRVWEDAFKTKQEDVDATNAVGPAQELVLTEFRKEEPNSGPSSSSLDPIEDDQAKKLSSSPSSSSIDSYPSKTSPSTPASAPSNPPTAPAFTAEPDPSVIASPMPPTSLDTAPLLDPTPPFAPTTTLGKDLDLAASLASRIDSHWYSSTSSSHETSNTRPAAEVEEPPVVDKTKSRKTRARPSTFPTADTSSFSSSPPPSTSRPTTSSDTPSPPKPTHEEEPTTTSPTFHFGAATTFFPPVLGFAGVYSSPPLRVFVRSSSSSNPASSANSDPEEKSSQSRTRGSKIVDVTLEGYDKNGALLRSFRSRFL